MSEHDRDTSEYSGITALREALAYITALEQELDALRAENDELRRRVDWPVKLQDPQMDRP